MLDETKTQSGNELMLMNRMTPVFRCRVPASSLLLLVKGRLRPGGNIPSPTHSACATRRSGGGASCTPRSSGSMRCCSSSVRPAPNDR